MDHEKNVSIGRSSNNDAQNGQTKREGNSSQPEEITVYKTRFWILGIFSLSILLDVAVWGSFGPIMNSVEFAYGWSDGYVALIDAWGPINSVLFMIPFSYLNQKYGLRTGMLLVLILITIGTAGRCMTMNDTAFKYLASFAGILDGMASSLTQSLPIMISSTWFPANERTTATATSVLSAQISSTIMYLSPILVRAPEVGVTREEIKLDIRKLMLIHFGLSAVLLACALIYFPAKPPKAPSISATKERSTHFQGMKVFLKNRDAVFVLITFAYAFGVPIIWISVMNFSLSCLGFSQKDTMYVAIATGILSVITGLTTARIADRFSGNMKKIIISLLCAATIFFLWFLLMTEGVIPNPSQASVYASVIGAISLSYAIVPVVMEFAIELSYPCPESSVGALSVLMLDSNGIIFLLLMMIPSECYRWLSYVLVLSVSIPIILMFTVKEKHIRLDIDQNNTVEST